MSPLFELTLPDSSPNLVFFLNLAAGAGWRGGGGYRVRDSVILKVVLCERVVIAVSAYRLFFSPSPKNVNLMF